MRSQEVPDLLGLPSTVEAAPLDTCSTKELTSLHRLWIDRLSEENWNATVMFFAEYAESVRDSTAVPVYALRQIPIPPDSCSSELALRAEMISAVESHLAELDIKFIDWDFELLKSDTFMSTGASDISILHGFGTALGGGHFNLRGHEASAEVLTDIVLSEIATRP